MVLCTSIDVNALTVYVHEANIGWGNLTRPSYLTLETMSHSVILHLFQRLPQQHNTKMTPSGCGNVRYQSWSTDRRVYFPTAGSKQFTVTLRVPACVHSKEMRLAKKLRRRLSAVVKIPLKPQNRLRTWRWRSQHIWLARTSTKALCSMQLRDYRISWPKQWINCLRSRENLKYADKQCTK